MTEQKKKVKACKDTEYLFISAYLRAKEPQLLNAEKAGRMLGSSVQEAARILESCGYADVLAVGLDKALSDRRAAVFSEVEALAPKDGVVALFRMRYDYHNAKTIVKAEAVGTDPAPLLSGAGRADAQALKTAYETGESGSVPQAVLTAMQTARDALSRSADPQLADLILDRAYFAEYHETAAGAVAGQAGKEIDDIRRADAVFRARGVERCRPGAEAQRQRCAGIRRAHGALRCARAGAEQQRRRDQGAQKGSLHAGHLLSGASKR